MRNRKTAIEKRIMENIKNKKEELPADELNSNNESSRVQLVDIIENSKKIILIGIGQHNETIPFSVGLSEIEKLMILQQEVERLSKSINEGKS